MVKILTLGNEFIEQDSLAKQVGNLLSQNNEAIPIKDSFQLMTILNQSNPKDIVIIDVVQNLKHVSLIKIEDLRNDSILSAHDFDASYILKLINKDFKIIGIPTKGNLQEIYKKTLTLIKNIHRSC